MEKGEEGRESERVKEGERVCVQGERKGRQVRGGGEREGVCAGREREGEGEREGVCMGEVIRSCTNHFLSAILSHSCLSSGSSTSKKEGEEWITPASITPADNMTHLACLY